MKRTGRLRYCAAGLVVLITAAVYVPALRNGFVNWDDDLYVVGNTHLYALGPAFLTWALFSFDVANWHPLTWLSHALDYAVWGLNPFGHHLTSIILHSLNTLLVLLLSVRLLEAYNTRRNAGRASFLNDRAVLTASFVAALLFGVHPLHVESVAWVAERKDVLCALFFLLSVMTYAGYLNTRDEQRLHRNNRPFLFSKQYLFALGFFILALMSKPMAVTLPLVLLLLDWFPYNRIQSIRDVRPVLLEKVPFAALSLFSAVVTIAAQKSAGAMSLTNEVPFLIRLLVSCRSLAGYLGNMIWPADLSPFYPYPRSLTFDSVLAGTAFAIVLLIVITVAAVIAARKQKVWLAAWVYYVVTLIPVLGLVQVGNQAMADRYTYLPSVGPFLAAGLVAAYTGERALSSRGLRPLTFLAGTAAVGIAALLIATTSRQITIWSDSIRLWDAVIEKNEAEPIAYYNRAQAYDRLGHYDKAMTDYDKAIALSPAFSMAWYNRAIDNERLGRIERAVADYDEVLRREPTFYGAYINRGLLSLNAHRYENALADLDAAVSLRPDDGDAYYNRGLVFEKIGKPDKAVDDYTRAISLNPNNADAYANRGMIYYRTGRVENAMADLTRARALKSGAVPPGF